MKNRLAILAGAILVVILLGACSLPSLITEKPAESGDVTFIIHLSPDVFSPEAVVSVYLYNEEQIAASEQTSECTISHDVQTGKDTIDCPEGVVYDENAVKPEEFQFAASQITDEIRITSSSVHKGEAYRLSIGGLGSDNCNQTGATVDGTVDSNTIEIDNLMWMSTMMACP